MQTAEAGQATPDAQTAQAMPAAPALQALQTLQTLQTAPAVQAAQAGQVAQAKGETPAADGGSAAKRSAPGDLRQRPATAATGFLRDDLGPVGGPTMQPTFDRAGAPGWTQSGQLPGTAGNLPTKPAGLVTGGGEATGSNSTAEVDRASQGRMSADALGAAIANTPGAPIDASGLPAALRPSEIFTLPTAAAADNAPQAMLRAIPGTADFAPQLGAQVAVWVRDGVHEARLQLNPADMGPVRVDIQLDGTAAQVNLSASNDNTRLALQDALPELAGSLREAGFTLAGGGVFDQPPQQRDTGGRQADAGRQPAASTTDAAPAGTQPATVRRRGLVDLVA